MTSRLLVDKIEGKDTPNKVQMPSGSIIQVVTYTATHNDNRITFSASSFTDAITINFTPKFSNSIIKHSFYAKTEMNNTDYNKGHDSRLIRDGSHVIVGGSWTGYFNRGDYSADWYPQLIWLGSDTPNTTNQVTYKFQGRAYGGNDSNHSWICFDNNTGSTATHGINAGHWTIEEIAG